MQYVERIPTDHIIEAIRYLSLSELKDVRNAIVEREIYYKRFFRKDDIENIISDFEKDGYGKGFLKELENNLRTVSYEPREMLFDERD